MLKFTEQFLKKLLFTKTGRGSLVMIVGSIVIGGANYLFHPVIIYLLGSEKYAEIATLISIFTIFSLSITALSTVVVKFTSNYFGKKDFRSIKSLLTKLSKKAAIFGLVIFFVILVLSPSIKSFLNLESVYPVIVLGGSIFFAFLFYINMGVLQGLLEFIPYTISNLIMACFRVILPVIAVSVFKFSVTGVMVAVALSILTAYLFSFYPLRFLRKEKEGGSIEWKNLFKFSFTTLLTVLGLGILSSIDIILVKHFFNSKDAGIYASAAVLSKIILFSTAPISQVMFPLVSERYAASKSYVHLLGYALGAVGLMGTAITIVYFLVPNLVVSILLPKAPGIVTYIGIFGVLITVYSLVYVLVNFFLSINKTAISYATLLAGVTLSVLIWFYHSSLYQIVINGIIVNVLLLAYLVVYFLLNHVKRT